ncbi:HpcH/HpaI aldolase family protein [Candidimonas nitroreducens]|uniref:Aldolase n=1 Tax=Candidimonas nitroreducens TaxID=683354 RepID=A0A225MVJ2_9BURK|nr:aldolase/citrate lyase family protein [Candidimonas nitroreducens]OWT63840.1 aldolase [Candidimonas nitroreducens]
MSRYENQAKRKMLSGGLAICMGLRQARTVDIAPIAAACGFDAIYVDMEHSPVSMESVSAICTAAVGYGITPLVRIPGHGSEDLSRVLDGGAYGAIVPHVETAEQAAELVRAAKYPPIGHRSVMGSGPSLGYRKMPLAEVNDRVNEETLLIVMLETPQGIANADQIAATPGVDMLLIGSNDLCTEMGIPGQLHHPDLRAAYQATAQACKNHGKILGIGGIRSDIELQTELLALGARFIIAGSDVTYLMEAASKDAQKLSSLGTKQ